MQFFSVRKGLPILVFCMLALTAGLPAGDARAQGSTRIYLEPAQALVGEGHTAAVEVLVENVQELYGLDIRLSFDPSVVEVVDADPAESGIQVRPGDLLSVDFVIKNSADNGQGTIWFALTQLNPSQPVSGSGTAFVITFRGKQQGLTSPIIITYQKMATRAGDPIAASAEDGEIRVVEPAQAPPTPTDAPPPPQPTVPAPTQPPTKPTTERPTLVPTQPPTMPASSDTPAPTVPFTPTQPPPTAAPTNTSVPAPTATPTPGAGLDHPEPTRPALPQTEGTPPDGGGLNPLLVLAGVAGAIVLAGVIWALRRATTHRS